MVRALSFFVALFLFTPGVAAAQQPCTTDARRVVDELYRHMLERSADALERVVLLQHAIDNITSTFYTQVLFADFELKAHKLAESGQPITAEVLSGIYLKLLQDYYGDAVTIDEPYKYTWARIPHFYQSPYYVYQYATCFATTARLMQDIRSPETTTAAAGVERYLSLLQAGGSDFPMKLLAQAGVDLGRPDTVEAVARELETLVAKLETELGA